MGLYDLPANINFVLKQTGQEKLTYVGHSQGTTQMILAASLLPWYFNQNVNLFVGLAPVISTKHTEVPVFKKLARMWRPLQLAAKKFGVFDMLDANWWEDEAELLFCAELDGLCEEFLAYFADANPEVDNLDRANVFLANFPAGTGYEDVVYYAQTTDNDVPKRFNYGERENLHRYGSYEPPEVPLKDLNIPVAVFSGSYDKLADPTDVASLVEALGSNVVFNQEYPLGHLSFGLAKDMSWFSGDVVNVMNQFSGNTASEIFMQ